MRNALPALLLSLLASASTAADVVVPSEAVRSHVIVREAPDRRSPAVGALRPGERAEYLGVASGWRRVRLDPDRAGFVSEAWTRVVADAPEAAEAPRPARGTRIGHLLGRALRAFSSSSAAPVEFEIRDPDPALRAYRNLDPELPVSGFARLEGAGPFHDVVLVLDVSSSTMEHAGADVNGDGRADPGWRGEDSIFAAQIAAVRDLLGALERLPGNRQGARIRVALVTYSGDEALHLRPQDADLEITPDAIFSMAGRDARLRVPLTRDYEAVRRDLRALARTSPVGMTNVAAGVGRAIVAIEAPEGDAGSRGRLGAQKVILFLTDGRPSLPYERAKAEEAASRAGRLAAESGIRINVFALGRNAVTRSANDAVKRMARRTGGSYVALESPAEIASVLRSTSFSTVERVRIANRTTGRETEYIATGIDGSFYGEIPLEEGENQIEVAALLDDGREASETFAVEYVRGAPARELAEQLKRIRLENEALIEEIKANLAHELRRKRAEQRRSLEMRVDETGSQAPAAIP